MRTVTFALSPFESLVPTDLSRSANEPSDGLTGDQLQQSSGSYELVLSAVVLGLLGWYLDRRIGSMPWLTITFTVLGMVGAGLSLYYRYKYQIAQLSAEAERLRSQARANSTKSNPIPSSDASASADAGPIA